MIIQGELSERQRLDSQKNWNIFNLFNGFSYMCLGDTVIILFAVQLGAPEYFISLIGSMIYFGFLLLPLGKIVTARVGAARSQSIFWYLRNGATMMVASCALWHLLGFDVFKGVLLLLGSFLFYGFRAAGVVMSQPLIAEITTHATRARFIGQNFARFYIASTLALLLVSMLLRFNQGVWMLTGIICFGAGLGVFSAQYMSKVYETERIRNSARRPINRVLRAALMDKRFRSMTVAGICCNLIPILIGPISVLALKKGYGISSTQTLLFALVQLLASIAGGQLTGPLQQRYGARNVLLAAYGIILAVPIVWLLAPSTFLWGYLLVPFILIGGSNVLTATAMSSYFIAHTAGHNRVGYSIFNSLITGTGAGTAGMLIGAGLLRVLQTDPETPIDLQGYKIYFLCVFILLLPGFYFLRKLHKKT